MDFDYTPKVREFQQRLLAFFDANIYPNEIAMIKVVAPNVSTKVIDWAIQMHGGAGVSDDFPLVLMYAQRRTLRFADGPDEVHRNSIATLEIARHTAAPGGR